MKSKFIHIILCIIIVVSILRFVIVFWSSLYFIEILSAFLDYGIDVFICYTIIQFIKRFDR